MFNEIKNEAELTEFKRKIEEYIEIKFVWKLYLKICIQYGTAN
jgi:hypothetical protein